MPYDCSNTRLAETDSGCRWAYRDARNDGQDQHALGVDRPAQFHFALDVDHLALAQPRGGRDPRRPAEREVAQVDDRQAVDLADHRAAGVDQQGAALDLLQHVLPQTVGAIDLLVDRLLDVLAR